MKYKEGKIGRVFMARIEHGESPLEAIKELAQKEKVSAGVVYLIGALEKGTMVVGPNDVSLPPVPVWFNFDDGREIVGIGTLALDEDNEPNLHMHILAGRQGSVNLGCLRKDAETYLILEAVVLEITNMDVSRVKNEAFGIKMLDF